MKDNRLVEMRVFKMVVEAGGFTAAANVMDVSQSFVSQTVATLERRLGVQLLHRSTRDRRLTAHGQRFLLHCEKVIREIEQEEAQMTAAQVAVQGTLRVSAPLSFGIDQIVPRLTEFQALHPEVQVSLSLSDTLVNLIEENVDVAIRMGRLHDSALISRRLCDLQRIVVASPKYLEARGTPMHPRDLASHNCLLWQGALEHLNRWNFVIDGVVRQITVDGNFRSSNGPTLYELCIAGVGILRSAEHVSLPAIRAKRLVPLLMAYQATDDTAIHAVYLPDRQLVPRIRAFVDYLVDVFRVPPWLAGEPGGHRVRA